ncbi:fasciclin domain-containing protein [Flagellimonas olearia]|uniref:Fasciclin domain-containing protein n=1 Tax=Flagellimonas olearia TaxID=552546 RepID=A0A6I1E4P9_9FLAO|nr:fasciclin domain-containing protein [Allomuricauda olearia]KAB7530910.1 fasciclin domain-containing protein [Allomuricauda olearia]
MKFPLTKLFLGLCMAFSMFSFAQSNVPRTKTIDSEHHKILLEAVKVTEMEEILEKSGPFTIFAPSDAAFERFSTEKIKELLNSQDKSALKSLLTYHIVAGHLTASRILRAMCRGNGKASFTTIQGKKLLAHMDGYDIVLTDPIGNTARITSADLNLKNGVVHEIDSVILPTQM